MPRPRRQVGAKLSEVLSLVDDCDLWVDFCLPRLLNPPAISSSIPQALDFLGESAFLELYQPKCDFLHLGMLGPLRAYGCHGIFVATFPPRGHCPLAGC